MSKVLEMRPGLSGIVVIDDEVGRLRIENARLRSALELIAAPRRADGTYNRDRESCRQLAEQALKEVI